MSTWVGAAGERPLKPGSTGLYSSDPFLREDRESSTCMLSDTAHGHVWVPGIKSGCVCVGGGVPVACVPHWFVVPVL